MGSAWVLAFGRYDILLLGYLLAGNTWRVQSAAMHCLLSSAVSLSAFTRTVAFTLRTLATVKQHFCTALYAILTRLDIKLSGFDFGSVCSVSTVSVTVQFVVIVTTKPMAAIVMLTISSMLYICHMFPVGRW